MDMNMSFLTGIACGACLCAFIFNRRRIFRLGGSATPSSTKIDSPKVFDDNGEYKMVLVVRNDLKMGKGKIAAQCSHAAVGAYGKSLHKNMKAIDEWEYTGQAKIALKVDSEQEMMDVHSSAKKAGLVVCLIRDAGRTQIAPNTRTVLGIGPDSKAAIDSVTGHLKLL